MCHVSVSCTVCHNTAMDVDHETMSRNYSLVEERVCVMCQYPVLYVITQPGC